jgi:type II secretory pathway component GspD/PulD (secretin)
LAKSKVKTSDVQAVTRALRNYFASLGVDLDSTKNPGKALFYNNRQDTLVIRATMQDLDIIEVAIQVINAAPPQINLKCKVVAVPQNDTNALGFDWYLANVLTSNGSIGGQAGSANSFPRSGILTDPQYRVVMKALQQRDGTELLFQPEVTTSSGRQVQCKAVDMRSLVKLNKQALTPPGITSTNDDESSLYVAEPMEFGVVFDMHPTVLEDGFTIRMPVIGQVIEFQGYEDARTNRVTAYVNGKPKAVTPPLPCVRLHQMAATNNVYDGQTLVLGGLVSERTTAFKDNVPVLGDLPLVGRLFRSESKNAQKRNLLIFITPTIIDPAGNRVHSPDEMPFSQIWIPPQPSR